MKYETLVKGGKVVIPKTGIIDADIAIFGGKITALLGRRSGASATETIDATGKYVLPGILDPHIHWGNAGEFPLEVTGQSRAASIGGCTTVISFMVKVARDKNGKLTFISELEGKGYTDDFFNELKNDAEKFSFIDFGYHMRIESDAALAGVERAIKQWGVTSFKFLMPYSKRPNYGNMYTDGLFYDGLVAIKKYGKGRAVACIHCENDDIVNRFTQKAQAAKMEGLPAWNAARPDFAEAEAVHRAMYFAQLTGCPLYIVHLSSRAALDEFAKTKQKNDKIYAEVCPEFLLEDINSPMGVLGKVNPPLRTKKDCEALWEGIKDGTVDTVGTSDTPRKAAVKLGNGDIWSAFPGMQGTGVMLPLLISEGYHKRKVSLERIVELTSYNAAHIFNLYPRKGTIMVGSDADLSIIDLNLEKTVTADLLQGYCDYILFDGWKVKGWPVATLVRGKTVMKDGKMVVGKGYGRYLKRNTYLKAKRS